MIESFVISILANLATDAGKNALKRILKSDDLETQINQAYNSALDKWSINDGIKRKEAIWTSRRLRQLLAYLKNPTDDFEFGKSTQELINLFYGELLKKTTAWNFIQGENFKTEITKLNSLENHFEQLLEELKKNKLQPDTVIKVVEEQTKNQIKKQIETEKYIPDTFIETNEFKDYLRYFVCPYTFYPKIFNEANLLDFTHLNRINEIKGKAIFDFSLNSFDIDVSNASKIEIYENSKNIINYLKEKHKELENNRTNLSSSFTRKIQKSKDAFEYINCKTLLLTDDAGQGKTNLLCDFSENVLLKREIPSIFFTGFEIDASDISKSISQKLFPNDDFTLNEILGAIENHSNKKQFIIIIDGINENLHPKIFSQNLETFIQSIGDKDFIKIILTCRTEYFQNNFQNLLKSTFKENIKYISGLNNRLNENQKQRLFDTYLFYFDIKIGRINKKVKKQLVDNFLLLRMFSEVNKGRDLPSVSHIYKTDLFGEYYKQKIVEINKRLANNDEFNTKGTIDIKNFINSIASYMVDNQTFHNIPLNDILSQHPENSIIFNRFLDENIILKKDLVEKTELIFEEDEVINFTFDEFRDFVTSNYLISIQLKKSKSKFKGFINQNLKTESPILEGCSIFIYALSRKLNNSDINDFIQTKHWFNTAFYKVIFNLPDNEITEKDKDIITDTFTTNLKIKDRNDNYPIRQPISEKIIVELAYHRYDEKKNPNLNITLLFQIFNNLTSEQFNSLVYPFYRVNYRNNNPLDELVGQLEEFLDKFEDAYHNLFKYILYFIPLSYKVKYLYKKYYNIHQNKKQLTDILSCKSKILVKEIEQLINDYEIQL